MCFQRSFVSGIVENVECNLCRLSSIQNTSVWVVKMIQKWSSRRQCFVSHERSKSGYEANIANGCLTIVIKTNIKNNIEKYEAMISRLASDIYATHYNWWWDIGLPVWHANTSTIIWMALQKNASKEARFV